MYPVLITPHYRSLIEAANPRDPLLRIVAPSSEEITTSGLPDTLGEQVDYRVRGLQHRYPATALLLLNDFCASYCRFCFRKRLFSPELLERETVEDLDEAISYIEQHPGISNVLLSGGDPLVSSTNRLKRVLERLSRIPHVQLVRIGTKIPAFLPQRLLEDDDLLDMLKEVNRVKPIYIVAHFDHAREISGLTEEAVAGLLRRGINVLSHAVLLKGVNDTPEALRGLFEAMLRARMEPYYLFHPMPVIGGSHFQLPLSAAYQIVHEATAMTSGLHKRHRYIIPHFSGKLEFLGLGDEHYFMRYQEAREAGMAGALVKVRRKGSDLWFNESDIRPM